MTLTISHGAFCGMCSEFHDWRFSVANGAGFALEETADGMTSIALDWNVVSDDNILGVWTAPPAEALLVLFTHSDIGGEITSVDARRLADRLSELPIPQEWHVVTQRFVAGCRLAVSRNEPLQFTYDLAATVRRLVIDSMLDKLFVDQVHQEVRAAGLIMI